MAGAAPSATDRWEFGLSRPVDTSAFSPPAGLREVADRLEDAGFEAWAVGGSIRDLCARQLVGEAYGAPPGATPAGRRRAGDWDLATSARPDDVIRLFRRTVPIGIEHGTVGTLVGDDLYEITTFRKDIETDGRHAVVTFADSIGDDLQRRDFTVNAIAWRPRTDELEDPHDGIGDLQAGVLRAVGSAADRFREDHLRVLRGFRFAGRFDLELEPETARAMEEAIEGLPRLSAERIREELMKVLEDPSPSSALDLYATSGALSHWYPELVPLALRREAWLETLAAIDAVRPHRPRVRLARLLVPVAEEAPLRAEATDRVLERLKFSNVDRKAVRSLVESYLPFVGPLDSAAQQRRWLAQVGDAWRDLFRLHLADARSGRSERASGYVVATWRRLHAVCLARHPLRVSDLAIDGADVLDLDVPRGPLVGLLLEELMEQVLEDPDSNQREGLLAEARRLVELGAMSGPRSADE